MKLPYRILALALLLFSAAVSLFAAGKTTVLSTIQPPPGYTRIPVKPGTFASSLRDLDLSDKKELLAGNGKTLLCDYEMVAVTRVEPFANTRDVGMDGIVRLWGDHLWKNKPQKSISFPLNNGQTALWKDWCDGLRPQPQGGRFIFMQITTPSGGPALYQQYLSFVAEEMGVVALRRESTIIFEDSVTVGDLIVALKKDSENRIGIILDACKGNRGEKLYLLGTCGNPSTALYIMRPYSPVQGVAEWFTLEGARWAVAEGERSDLRRVTLE